MREKGGKYMKKISIPSIKKKSKEQAPSRITNETVAEHRERVIAEGRRYKYPLQYARHKLVINTIVVSVAAVIILLILGWWQLYVVQNTSTFFYRVTQVLPLPAGTVNGQDIRYSDYMLYYRPSEYYLSKYDEIKPDSQDGKLQLEYKKRDAMDRAIADAYARQVAKQQGLTVSADEVNKALDALKQADNGTLSADAVKSSAQQVFGMTERDTRSQYRNSILRGKVAFAIDDEAKSHVEAIQAKLVEKKSLKDIAAQLNKEQKNAVQYGVSGLISKTSVFNGVRVAKIAALKKNETSGPIKSVTNDGYLFVRMLSANDKQVNFEFVHVPLTKFDSVIQALKDDGKVHEYIRIDPDQYMSK